MPRALQPQRSQSWIHFPAACRGVLAANLDGSLGFLAPVWLENMVPHLRALQRLLELKVRQPAGLNPRSFRSPPLPLPTQ